ncbi:uncharacterized protein LOC120333845 [Styela clava]
MDGWKDGIKRSIENAKANCRLECTEFGVFTKNGSFCTCIGTSKIEGSLDEETRRKIAGAFDQKTENAMEDLQSYGIKVGTVKYKFINGEDKIVFSDTNSGLVFVDAGIYIAYGISAELKTDKANVIAGCQSCAEWLKDSQVKQ